MDCIVAIVTTLTDVECYHAIQGRGVAQGSAVAGHAISSRSAGARRLWLPGWGLEQQNKSETWKITTNMFNSKFSVSSKQQKQIGGLSFRPV